MAMNSHAYSSAHLELTGLERLGMPSCAVDRYRRIIAWNQPATEFFGMERADVLGREWHTAILTLDGPRCCAVCETMAAVRGGEPAVAIDACLEVRGRGQQVIMVPFPLHVREEILAFVIMKREPLGAYPVDRHPVSMKDRGRRIRGDRIIGDITDRERQVLSCIVEGMDARSTALHLGISHATARNYIQCILTKLGVHSKAEAVSVALRYNLLAEQWTDGFIVETPAISDPVLSRTAEFRR